MGLKHPLIQKSLALLGATVLRAWRATVDCRALYFDPTVDPLHPRFSGRKIFVAWHEYLLLPTAFRGGPSMLTLVSQHSDGEVIARAMKHLGWRVARGSSKRGGVSALMRLLKENDDNLNLLPDGPRGPRRTMSFGTIYLASRLGIPIVCMGYGARRPWRFRSWDRFAIPRPFSRCRTIVGPPLLIPADLDRDDLELYRGWFEKLMHWLTERAEQWAESGRHVAGSMPMHPRSIPLAMHRDDYQTEITLSAELLDEWRELPGQSEPVRRARKRARAA